MSKKNDTLFDWIVECGCGALIGWVITLIIIIIIGLLS